MEWYQRRSRQVRLDRLQLRRLSPVHSDRVRQPNHSRVRLAQVPVQHSRVRLQERSNRVPLVVDLRPSKRTIDPCASFMPREIAGSETSANTPTNSLVVTTKRLVLARRLHLRSEATPRRLRRVHSETPPRVLPRLGLRLLRPHLLSGNQLQVLLPLVPMHQLRMRLPLVPVRVRKLQAHLLVPRRRLETQQALLPLELRQWRLALHRLVHRL